MARTKATRKSNRSHVFSEVPRADIPRSSFDRSSNTKTAFNAGDLVPIFVDEVLPGDTFNLRAALFGRLATPVKPVLENMYLETFFFFVPNRLVWDNWQKFCGEQENPGDSTDFQIPTVGGTATAVSVGTIYDYFGLPLGTVNGPDVSALPFRCYNLIYSEWFRDQNLQTRPNITTGDGPDGWASYSILKRGKRHDYFTSCLPWPQKGDPVTVDLAGYAPVGADVTGTGDGLRIRDHADGTDYNLDSSGATLSVGLESGGGELMLADLSNATGFTINDLRQSFQIQRLLERDARGGTRYTELVRSHFGVTSPDSRLQRPEFLGGGRSMITVNPVPQTVADDTGGEQPPLGNLAAYGVVQGKNHGFTKSFTEHGHIIGLACVRADLTYQQGLQRMWSRKNRFDYFWPALSHLGEMAVLNQEIYYQADAQDKEVFGYQEAWGDYRYKPSNITGIMRSQAPQSLDVWHLAQDFANLPVLGPEFIEEDPPFDRIIAVQDEPHLLLDMFFKLRCARPMPLYGVPGLIDHF